VIGPAAQGVAVRRGWPGVLDGWVGVGEVEPGVETAPAVEAGHGAALASVRPVVDLLVRVEQGQSGVVNLPQPALDRLATGTLSEGSRS